MGLFSRKTKLAPEVIEKRKNCQHDWRNTKVSTLARNGDILVPVGEAKWKMICIKCGAIQGE